MTNFKFNDGGRDKYFKGKNVGDCVTRAIAIATNQDYKKVYDDLNLATKDYGDIHNNKVAKSIRRERGNSSRSGLFKEVFEPYILSKGFKWKPLMKIGSGCKVHLLKEELPTGILIARVSKHLTTVIDGVINDTYDCSRNGTRCVYGYWIKEG